MFQPRDNFHGPPLERLQHIQCLSCTEAPRVGCNTPDAFSQEQKRGGEPLPSTCWPCFFRPDKDMVVFMGYKHTLTSHVSFFLHRYPKVLLCSQSIHAPVCVGIGYCPDPAVESCTWLCLCDTVHLYILESVFQYSAPLTWSYWHMSMLTKVKGCVQQRYFTPGTKYGWACVIFY